MNPRPPKPPRRPAHAKPLVSPRMRMAAALRQQQAITSAMGRRLGVYRKK